ncbi:MAG: tRNA guanosine(34) transglycosylase Tgt [Patescibacteria group bacterium]
MSFFELIHEDKKTGARAGVIHTEHGDIPTPVFMPVGTQASVKTIDQTDLLTLDPKIILANNYHLHLRPGEDLIAQAGGLHKFMNWDRAILTDSGGFQVFSLGLQKEQRQSGDQGRLVKIDEDGVTFQSHIDGSTHRFTPESAINCQQKIGADIIMAFDECTPDNADFKYTKEAMDRTHRWAERCLKEHQKNSTNHGYKQFLFGIIQGANHEDLRKESAKYISSLEFDGIAIGGESIGYNMEATENILRWVMPLIPKDKPRYTMGVGLDPMDLLKVVAGGADMFDCVAPTRLARHGMVLVSSKQDPKRRMNIKNSIFAKDFSPISVDCTCLTCQNYSRAYIHHLFLSQEVSGLRLATIHNLQFMLNLMKQTREAILEDRFEEILAF